VAFLRLAIVSGHAVDRFEFEGESIDQGDLLRDVHSVDVLLAVLRERAVGHHGILSTCILVVDRDDHWVVVLDTLAKFEGGQVVRIELDLAQLDLLVDPRVHWQVLDVILAIRRVEHLRRIIRVLLLRDAHVDADVRVAERIILESDLEFVAFWNFLLTKEGRKY
jgi:hypothetical protein